MHRRHSLLLLILWLGRVAGCAEPPGVSQPSLTVATTPLPGPLAEADAATPPDAPAAAGIRPSQRPVQTAAGNTILYFTFDDGPWATYTEAIAAVLAENGGRGTFFAIGRQVDWTPAIPAALVPAYSVQNHTYNHNTLDGIGRTAFFSEVEQTLAALQLALPQLRAQGYVFEALCG